jgi:hypothetical protein
MKPTLEPCLFEYFVFLIKEQGEFNKEVIDEIATLWHDLCVQYGLEEITEDLQEKVRELSTKIYLDKSVKIINTLHTPDKLVWLRQSLAHDALIITFLVNSPPGTKTDKPWKFWQDFYYEIVRFRPKLKGLFYYCTMLQTIISGSSEIDGSAEDENLSKQLQAEFEPYRAKKVLSANLSQGKLCRFGDNHKFMFTLTKDQEEDASMFLANDFPYIVSLLGKIENHYLMAVDLYETLNGIERTARGLETQLIDIYSSEDIQTLENSREEISELGKSSIEKVSTMQICGNNISANLKNLKSAFSSSTVSHDNFLTRLFETYEEYVENIESWSEVGRNILMRITKYVDDAKLKLTESIQQEQMKESLQKVPEKKSPYTIIEGSDDFDLDDSSYPDKSLKPGMEPSRKQDLKGPLFVEWSSNYIFYEEEPGNCFNLLKSFCQADFNALCITRQHPDKMKSRYGLKKPSTKIFWLSMTACDYCLPPSLTRIAHEISKFLKEDKRRIILIDGVEFLVNHNDFNTVYNFLENVKENIILHDSILLITISPNAFTPKELSLLKKNTEGIYSIPAGFDLSKL